MEVTKFTGLLGSGYVKVVGNYQCNAANLNQREKPHCGIWNIGAKLDLYLVMP